MKPLCPGRIFPAGLGGRKPRGAVDLGKRLLASAFRRPFQLECVGLERFDVEVAFHRPRRHDLAARLHELAERAKLAVRARAGFLLELAHRDGERLLALGIFAFRDRPGAQVLLGPERPARMHQQHFDAAAVTPIHQDAGAALGHRCRSQPIVAGDRARHLDRNGVVGVLAQTAGGARRRAFEAAPQPIAEPRRGAQIHVDGAADHRRHVEIGDREVIAEQIGPLGERAVEHAGTAPPAP